MVFILKMNGSHTNRGAETHQDDDETLVIS